MADTMAADAAGTPNTSIDFVWSIAMEKRMEIGYLAEAIEDTQEEIAARAGDLTAYASKQRSGIGCRLLPRPMNSGGTWLIRLLEFDDGVRWVARLALFPKRRGFAWMVKSEVDTQILLKEHGVPVPEIYAFDVSDRTIGRPFILMEFLPYHSNLDVTHSVERYPTLFPLQDKYNWPENFLRSMAEFQVRLSSVRLPAIGRITRSEDGKVEFYPGNLVTAVHTTTRSYLEDWIDHELSIPSDYAQFYRQSQQWADKSIRQLRGFPSVLTQIAKTFNDDNGDEAEAGFPVFHYVLSSQDVLVDDDLNVTGVVDWTSAQTVPWALVRFPEVVGKALRDIPGFEVEPMRPEVWYRQVEALERYVVYVKEAEDRLGTDHKLSATLGNAKFQYLNQAMRQYQLEVGPNNERLKHLFLSS